MTVDDELNWEDQFRSVKEKIASGLASSKKLKNIISQSQLMEVYYAPVESNLRNANVVWEAYPIQKWKHFSGCKTEPLI